MIKQIIQEDLKKALKERNEIVCSTLRMLLAAVLSKEKEKRYKISKEEPGLAEEELIKKSDLTDEEMIEVVFSENKKRKEAVLEYEKGGRKDLADKERAELKVLEKYLPEQIPEEEIKRLAKEAIEKTGAKEMKDMGRIMAELMPKIKGRADKSEASRIIKELLS